ncbi:hypothetical protein JKF63_07685 [Porcisia hertigi]|uniref:Uncharacterized protein n=1 Tax=Porcisia hertigi TaxID=2761500 RepID=A0A836IXN9_9TRYP|nr:hypothetical protein JKF63_07685 [Porcisia hertigi]
MRLTSAIRSHPYAIDPKSLRAEPRRKVTSNKISIISIGKQSARQAWNKTQDLIAFLIPGAYRGGPRK